MSFLGGLWRKVTGGTADVTLTVGAARRSSKAPVTVDVAVGPDPISPKRVYVKLRCVEQVEIPKYALPKEGDDKAEPGKVAAPDAKPKTVDVKAEECLFEKEFVLGPGREMAAKSTHKFEGQIELPAHLPPSFNGKLARVKWTALAGLSTSINDPDSGWQEVSVA